MIGIVGKNGLEDPKEDVAAAIIPNGRVLASSTFIRENDKEPNPEYQREFLTNMVTRYKERMQDAEGEQTIKMAGVISFIGSRLDTGYNDSYRMMIYSDDSAEQRYVAMGPLRPISEAKDLIKEAGLR